MCIRDRPEAKAAWAAVDTLAKKSIYLRREFHVAKKVKDATDVYKRQEEADRNDPLIPLHKEYKAYCDYTLLLEPATTLQGQLSPEKRYPERKH